MINTIYRLSAPKFFEEVFVEETDFNKVIVRPKFLSICQADQRYFNGNRPPEVLSQKLPMALFHEAVGEVIYSPDDSFDVGDKVVMIPNTPTESDDVILENYLRSSKFRSSGYDGFMSEYVFMNSDRLVKLPDDINLEVAAFTELISVGMHAISRFKMFSHKRKEKIGVWGDGSFGYITSLLLKYIFPESEVYIFGVNYERLSYFSFTDKRFKVNEVPDDLKIDHAFECVGSTKAQDAINQIIDIINPQGSISLLGVSEYNVPINTRMVLEKGLNIFGSSRSGYVDFKQTVDLLNEHPQLINYFENLITNKVTINEISDIYTAFELDLQSKFGKTVLKWDI
jgi:ribitol-5-phosphate 2-dehydrogenase